MSYITIRGGRPLRGEITVQGAKNSVLPILAATLLAGDECRIEGCPHLSDVDSACDTWAAVPDGTAETCWWTAPR